MFDLNDVETIEGAESQESFFYASLQRAIDSGMWSLQGSYGRTMMAAIEEGRCMLGQKPARDYYGNRIPSRDEVKAGTMGSYEFVADRMGVEWADMLASA